MDNRTIRLSDAIEAIAGLVPEGRRPEGVQFRVTITIADAIEALSALPAVEGWLPISHDTPANQTLLLGWRDWRDATWCIEIAPYQTEHRIGAYSSVSCHRSATHYLPTSILPAPPEIE